MRGFRANTGKIPFDTGNRLSTYYTGNMHTHFHRKIPPLEVTHILTSRGGVPLGLDMMETERHARLEKRERLLDILDSGKYR